LEEQQYYINIEKPYFCFMEEVIENEIFLRDLKFYIKDLCFRAKQKELQKPYIEKQKQLAKEQRKKALMQQLLSGKKRLPGFTEDWKEVSLGKLFSERVETKREDLELLSVGQQGVYPQTESNKRDISNADKSKYKRIVPGDIGYNTMRMWQGRSAFRGAWLLIYSLIRSVSVTFLSVKIPLRSIPGRGGRTGEAPVDMTNLS
jgi:hypothetical protein